MTYAVNKKATFNYEVLEKYEGGLELHGNEVKSIKNKRADLTGSFVIIRGNELFLVNASIPPYQVKNTPENYDSERPRRILMSKKEILKLTKNEAQKGLTLVPMSLYNKGRYIKLEFALVRGKKKSDKRETIKGRDAKREIERTLKSRR